MLNKNVPIPLYYQIKEDIIRRIENEEYKTGEKLPSENEMQKIYNVSLITTRKALMELVNDGYIYRIQGKGSYVAEPKINRQLSLMSFTEEMKQKGYICATKVLDYLYINDQNIANKLGVSPEEEIIKIPRLRLVENEPIALQISYLPGSLLSTEELNQVRKSKSLYQVLEGKGIIAHKALEKYSIKLLHDHKIYSLLNVPKNSPSFYVKRLTYTENKEIFEYAVSFLRWDKYSIEVEVSK